MRTYKWSVFRHLGSEKKKEILGSEPLMLTVDGDSLLIAMTEDCFNGLFPLNPNPKRQPRRRRFEGVMYREEI